MKKTIQIKNKEGTFFIFDQVRNKYIVLTPEEMVRQKFIYHLVNEKGYSKESIILEYSFKINEIRKRADLVIFNREGEPYILMEFKKNNVKIDNSVIDQVMIYNTIIKAKILAITNGKNILVLEKQSNGYIRLEKIPNK